MQIRYGVHRVSVDIVDYSLQAMQPDRCLCVSQTIDSRVTDHRDFCVCVCGLQSDYMWYVLAQVL